MGYDFVWGGEERFRWSQGNWERVLDMAGLRKEDYLKQEQTLSKDMITSLLEGIGQAVTELKMPDMSVINPIQAFHDKTFNGKPDINAQSNVWVFSIPFIKGVIMITEDDPRWQGIFFNHLTDFLCYLKAAIKENKEILVS